MRIVIALAAILSVALAGCGRGPNAGQNGQNAAGPAAQGGLPTPGARPQSGTAAPQNFDNGFRLGFRNTGITTCVSSAEGRAAQGGGAAPGTDFRPACTCYIDRAMAGLSTEQLQRLTPGPREQAILEQCARENGLQADGGGK
jgi:hypothetical protein